MPPNWSFLEQPSYQQVWDTLGEPTRKFDYLVKYSKSASIDIPFNSIIPSGWGEEFGDNEEMNYCANYVDDHVF